MAKQAAAPQPRRRLRVIAPSPAIGAPVLTLEEALHLYIGLMEQSRQLGEHVQMIRTELLRTMDKLGIKSVREPDFEVIRQVRRRAPKIDYEKAEALLQRFGRLRECLVPRLDEEKVQKVVDELVAKGEISEEQAPYTYTPESEVLIVRKVA
ncbi:MAG: hypothetical protein HYY30_03700 [Chloroflexi bacterium]|nr:hypothetical protein [Chloroflexota bacterium]